MQHIITIPLTHIRRDQNQPRSHFDAQALLELADSIKQCGVLQPILVREDPEKSSHFIVIAGERRYQASKRAGLKEVPCLVRADSIAQVRSIQLHENFNRENLSLAEIIEGVREYKAAWLAENPKGKLTNKALAAAVGQNTTFISRLLKLDSAPVTLLNAVYEGTINNINVASNLTDLHALSPETFESVWGEYNDGQVTGSFEKHTAGILKNTKILAEGGLVLPECNEYGVFDTKHESVQRLRFSVDAFCFEILSLEVEKGVWICAYDCYFHHSYSSSPLSIKAKDRYSSQREAELAMLTKWIVPAAKFACRNLPNHLHSRFRKLFAEFNRLLDNLAGEPELPKRVKPVPEKINGGETTISVCNELCAVVGTLDAVYRALVSNFNKSPEQANKALVSSLKCLMVDVENGSLSCSTAT
ncbi:ParB/RepB/Spo0J family partition protein [Enterovibrio paralichthyis]|uniref:ParB/RepB/Spo0J family partition protein n=1 Tax=Enterovibrio paralichthyis TaxID=2853805 RepID=UPI001C453ECA|nr:ParB/RepB/Spo0J family partition protein [Enterovibrio paralichthyis]MBV7300218.1 ParB/RepB/Spo0J family partition protein [Enterovibrio paralichthyis]